jgi:hypothetical protein
MKVKAPDISKNRKKRGVPKGFHPVKEWKPGQSGNPTGAPRKGMSTAETIRTLKALTPDELRRALRAGGGTGKSGMEKALAAMPQGVPLGLLMNASAMIHTTCEPTPGVLAYLRDSDEGKPVEKREIMGENGGPVKVSVVRLVDSPKDKA